MYYYYPTYFGFDYFLIAAAVIPAIILMIRVYKSDRLERESPAMLWRLVRAGIFSSLIALVLERISEMILNFTVSMENPLYNIILYFVIVAFSEEGAKYLLLNRKTWNSPEFNCQYDGVVYAVFVSLGFAMWENISYVLSFGFGTAIIRALTAIPGHACFGVFMGVFYGIARKYENLDRRKTARFFRVLALILPALLHGLYDYIATEDAKNYVFIGFVVILFLVSYILVGKMSKTDQYIAKRSWREL